MRTILNHIEQKKRSLAESPLFAFLKDTSFSPRERFGFAPCIAPFVMSFADVNKLMLRDDSSKDPLQAIINTHSREDDHHWRMFLKDLDTLSLDVSMSLGQALKLLWGDDRQKTRKVSYGLAAIIEGTNPKVRMAVVEAIEATGNVAFPRFREVAQEFKEATGKELYYFGEVHEELETGHAAGSPDVEEKLARIVMTAEEEAEAIVLVNKVFQLFADMFDELLAYAERAVGPVRQLPAAVSDSRLCA